MRSGEVYLFGDKTIKVERAQVPKRTSSSGAGVEKTVEIPQLQLGEGGLVIF